MPEYSFPAPPEQPDPDGPLPRPALRATMLICSSALDVERQGVHNSFDKLLETLKSQSETVGMPIDFIQVKLIAVLNEAAPTAKFTICGGCGFKYPGESESPFCSACASARNERNPER